MGEIMDEFDEGENTGVRKTSDFEYIIDSKVPINDIERELDIDFPDTEFETLGGYLLERFERVPKVGEEMQVNGFHFKILAASRSKIEKIRFKIIK
jgi:CBS domain containing-hemolysin-like protein